MNEVYYFFGKPGGDEGIFDADGNVLSVNNNLKKSEFLADNADGTAQGIREIIQQRNKEVLVEINKLKEKFRNEEINQTQFDSLARKVRRSEDLKKPVIIIKSTDQASYGSLVQILDEMQINSISKYQNDNMTRVDSVMLIDYQNTHHGK